MKKQTITGRTFGWMLLCMTLAVAGGAWAVGLDQAKAQGLVGERPNGYLGVVEARSAATVETLVREINQRRREKYREIAQRNGTSVDVVEKLAGKKAIDKTPAGEYVQLPSGQWVRK